MVQEIEAQGQDCCPAELADLKEMVSGPPVDCQTFMGYYDEWDILKQVKYVDETCRGGEGGPFCGASSVNHSVCEIGRTRSIFEEPLSDQLVSPWDVGCAGLRVRPWWLTWCGSWMSASTPCMTPASRGRRRAASTSGRYVAASVGRDN